MDNLTHTLVGVLVGESAARAIRTNATGLAHDVRRHLFVSLMAIGGNLPDLDFIQSRITGSKLDYLLHHRGHTHTVMGALALAALLYLACEAWCRWRQHRPSRVDRMQLGGIACLSVLLHIALDATNSYGVHPFWPWDNRWYYGDAVFIVEPSFWAACAPLAFILRSALARGLVIFGLIAGCVLCVVTGMVPIALTVCFVALSAVMLAVGKLARPATALTAAIIVWLGINVMFVGASAVAHQRARVVANELFPTATLVDVVLTPLPLNPACWQTLWVQVESGQWYVRRAALSIAPSLIEARRCPSRGDVAQSTAAYAPVSARQTPSIAWQGETVASLEALRDWVRKDCHAADLMRFARAPWLVQLESRWVLGDARFDLERALSFAEIELGSNAPCMSYTPPWTPPRADLLE